MQRFFNVVRSLLTSNAKSRVSKACCQNNPICFWVFFLSLALALSLFYFEMCSSYTVSSLYSCGRIVTYTLYRNMPVRVFVSCVARFLGKLVVTFIVFFLCVMIESCTLIIYLKPARAKRARDSLCFVLLLLLFCLLLYIPLDADDPANT